MAIFICRFLRSPPIYFTCSVYFTSRCMSILPKSPFIWDVMTGKAIASILEIVWKGKRSDPDCPLFFFFFFFTPINSQDACTSWGIHKNQSYREPGTELPSVSLTDLIPCTLVSESSKKTKPKLGFQKPEVDNCIDLIWNSQKRLTRKDRLKNLESMRFTSIFPGSV